MPDDTTRAASEEESEEHRKLREQYPFAYLSPEAIERLSKLPRGEVTQVIVPEGGAIPLVPSDNDRASNSPEGT